MGEGAGVGRGVVTSGYAGHTEFSPLLAFSKSRSEHVEEVIIKVFTLYMSLLF